MKIKIFLILLFLTIIGFLTYKIYTKATHIETVKAAISSLPDFKFISLEGKAVTKEQVINKPVLIVFFLTDCEYCIMEIDNLLALKEVDKINIWLVSPEPDTALKEFMNKNKLRQYPHVKVLRDWKNEGSDIFGVASTPTSFLYMTSGFLIKRYNGAVKPEVVLMDLAKENKVGITR